MPCLAQETRDSEYPYFGANNFATSGKRVVWGGRAAVRTVLYMGALVGARRGRKAKEARPDGVHAKTQ